MVRKAFAAVFASVLFLLFLSPALAQLSQQGPKLMGTDAEADGPEPIRERVRLYLQRHGDKGQMDPESRRKRVAAEYAFREAERTAHRVPLGVCGSNWVSLGPTNGAGRMTALAPHPTIAGTLYAGAADGGVWKTTDGGVSWVVLTDSINDLSVGALALAPSSPNIIYLGSGEGGYAVDFIPGIGFLKSEDGGNTWAMPASVIATMFYRISVHPSNPLELVVGTNQGGLRSTDGGATWSTVISPATYGDVTDIVRDPTNAQVIYAASWRTLGTMDATKVLKSTDGGATWVEKSSGLPTSPVYPFWERLSLAISPSSPNVLYAATSLYDNGTNSCISHIYKTTTGGDLWVDLPGVSSSSDSNVKHYLKEQAWYDNTLIVSPTDPNLLFAGGVSHIRSTDGGTTFSENLQSSGDLHVDFHDLCYQGAILFIANDGGIWSSSDNGFTFTNRNAGLVTRQYYAMANDPVNRNRVLAGSQDNGTDQRTDAGGLSWRQVFGGDGIECAINPVAPSIAYCTYQGANILRTKDAGGEASFSDITPPYSSGEIRPFFSLLTLDPSNPSTLYTGTYRVWQSPDGGDSWAPLPTTTTDGSTWDPWEPVRAIAVAQSNGSILMVAIFMGVFRSTNGGASWVYLSIGQSEGTINNLEIDPITPNVAYAALATTSGQSVYQTTNGGASWIVRSSGLPPFAAQVVRVDPTDSNILYCGTDVGVYRSINRGETWTKFGTSLPNSSVQDLRILQDASILRVATHGRGVWELEVPTIAVSPASLVGGTVGTGYSQTITASGGRGPYTFAMTSGSLAPGLTFNGSAGVLSGTPTTLGTYSFTLTVTDSNGCSGSRQYKLTITDIVTNPPVISSVKKVAPPFAIVVMGSNLQSGIKAYINDVEWLSVLWKTTGKIKLTGGAALKAAVPKNTPAQLRFVNPDGGETTTTFQY